MAEALSISVSGVKELEDSLNKLKNALKANEKLNKELSSTLAKKASALAPVLTGALASSVEGNPSSERARIVAGNSAVPYAGVIEYGWPQKGREAKPYLRPAVNNNMGYIINQYNESIKENIKKYNLD